MGIASLIIGVLTLTGVCVALIPLFNLFNCLTLPVALFGAIFGLVDLVREDRPGRGKGAAIAGLALNSLALLIGGLRFAISLLTTGGLV